MSTEVDVTPPEWQRQLDLSPDDSAVAMLTAVSRIFAALALPANAREGVFPRKKGPISQPSPDLQQPLEERDFKYGVDYFFGKYQGKPLSVSQNAGAAVYQGRQGVELWRIMKSVAFAAPDQRLIIAHVRGDRTVDEAALAATVEIEKSSLAHADVSSIGVDYGTVNPFIRRPTISLLHLFDDDLVDGVDYPHDDIVITSSGDPRYFVGFDIRRYLRAISSVSGDSHISSVTKRDSKCPRIIARRPIHIVGGDSGIDTLDFGKSLLSALRRRLEEKEAYYGDRSLARLYVRSDPTLAGSIDTALYGRQLRARVTEIVAELQIAPEQNRPGPIVTFSSMAMHGAAGGMLRKVDGIEYVGPKEALTLVLAGLESHKVAITHIVLLGLSSAYDEERSAFAGEILNRALPIDENVRRQIHKIVQDCKKEHVDTREFYRAIRKVLQRVTRGNIDALKGSNIAVILGASELESFANAEEAEEDPFIIIKSNDLASVAERVAGAPDKICLILIQPGLAVGELIARRALGLP